MATAAPKHTILIVEDERSLREALRDKFARAGFAVFEANNGEEGLATALREHPDLILLDIVMPVMDGMTMLTHLREDAWGKNARVIILTNLTSDDEQRNRDINETESSYYLVKSDWKLEDIVATVQERLGDPPAKA